MRFFRISVVVCVMWVHTVTASACPSPDARQLEQHLAALNAARSDSALAPLVLSADLTKVAQKHACDMATRRYFSHTSPDGTTMEDRLRDARLPGTCRGAENIAKGQTDVASVMRSWMGSAGHRQNMLDIRLTQVGFGLGPGNVWVQLFAGPCR